MNMAATRGIRATDSDVPDGWVMARLPDCAETIMGQSPPGSTYNENQEGLPFFQGKAEFGMLYPTATKWCTDPRRIAETGDILISVRAPVGPTNIANKRCIIGRGLAAIRPRGGIRKEIILYALRIQEKELAEQGTGSTFTAIKRSVIEDIFLSLPPLAEQERIVAKLEEVLERVNNARERLARVPAILKRFRQSVLAAACSGRLTADWREQHPDVERADHALCLDADLAEALPDTWHCCEAGTFFVDARYGTSVKCEQDARAGIPVLRVPNIALGKIDLSALKYGPLTRRETENLALVPGDVLICRTNGSLDLVGKAAVWERGEHPYAFASYLIRVRFNTRLLLPTYYHLAVSSPLGRDHIEDKARTTAGQFNLNLDILRSFLLPVPPLPEQREILRRTNSLLLLTDTIEQRVTQATRRADKLTQSTLAKAFHGELVPTEAELARAEGRPYESAAELLERIQREKAFQQAQSGTRSLRRRGDKRSPCRANGGGRHSEA